MLITWSSCNIAISLRWWTWDNSLVTAMQLWPSFLKKEHPHFVSKCLRKAWMAIYSNWNIIIHHHQLPLAIFVEEHSVNLLVIDLIWNEHLPNPIRMLSQHAKSSEEIAVSERSLSYIYWLGIAIEDHKRIFGSLGLALPGKLCPFFFLCKRIGLPIFDQAFSFWRKLIIGPLAICNLLYLCLEALLKVTHKYLVLFTMLGNCFEQCGLLLKLIFHLL